MSRRHEYIEMIKQQLDEVNAKIDEWQARRGQAEGRAKGEYEEKLSDLRERAASARAKIDEMRDASDETWEELKAEMERIRRALVSSYNYFRSQL